MKHKKLMLLGGIRYLLPVIDAAHKLGVYVITADYLPDNVAHKYSDEYVNVSIIDRDAVLKVAREKQIDGILSFGVDPGVVTAAYVADRMGLPSPPLASVEILQNKDRFRDFLAANGFNCPWHISIESCEKLDLENLNHKSNGSPFPCIVKPVDSAGSKGCSRVDSVHDLYAAVEYARSESHNGRIIIEQFLEKIGCSSDSDSFSIDDELVFCSFNNQHFDISAPNPFTPAGFTWPSNMPDEAQTELRNEIQRLIQLLNLGTSIYNVETRVCTDGKPYIMEVSPRGGGNRLSEVLRLATGIDLIKASVCGALGLPFDANISEFKCSNVSYNGNWAESVVHSNKPGAYVGLNIDTGLKAEHVVQIDEWIKPGDAVSAFSGANQTIGTLVLKFDSHEQAEKYLSDTSWLEVKVT